MGSICDPVPMMNSSSSSTAASSSIPPFLSKTYDMVDDQSTNDVVSWSSGNNSFVVWNVPEFAKLFLPKYFKHNNFSSFVRQLNTYGFRKVDPDRWEFANEGFLRGQKQRLKTIVRRKPSQVQPPTQPQVQHSSVGACTEVGKFGLEEEVDRLQRDKNVLMQELVRLRQQQLVTEHHLQNVGQKVHVMELRQQQMMSFLAKAVQSPGFVNQFSQQQQQHNNDSNRDNRRISESNKKRRLPVEEAQKVSGLSNQQQMVKYQEAYNHGGFRSSSNASDNGSSSNGVNLADVSSNPGMKYRNQVMETNLPYSRGSKQGGGSSGSPNSDNGECFDPIMAVLDGSIELNAINDLLDVPKVPEVPEVQDFHIWEQFFGGGGKTQRRESQDQLIMI